MTELVSSHMHLPSKMVTRYDVELYLHQNATFAQNFVVQYLKRNPEFTDQYFIENSSRELFQKWHEQNVNLSLHRSKNTKMKKTPFNVSINEEEETSTDVNEPERECKSIDLTNRRKSDPIKKDLRKRNGGDALDTITEFSNTRELRKSYTFPKTKYRTISVDDNNNTSYTENSLDCEQSTQWIYNLDSNYNKPYLRKAKSAPAYKANLSHLIQSSVYSGSLFNRQINVENRMLLKHLNEENLLVEMIKDVSKDLSLNRTCFRILVNFGFMLNIEKASIYIAYENKDTDFLRLQLQHVTIEDGVRRGSLIHKHAKEDCVPFGEGIVGQVAITGESFISNDIEKTGVYNIEHDKWYDETVNNVLLHPLKDVSGKTIAVIVGLNSKTGEFTEEDKEIGSAFLSFCGVSITNAKIFEKTKEEFDRNKDLLELSHDVFEEQTSLNKVIQKVLNRAIEMFKCKKCSLMLIDDPKESDERRLFSKLFQVTSTDRKEEYRFSKFQRDSMVFSSSFDPFIDGVADPKALNSRQNKKLILHSTPISSVQTGIYKDKDTICIPIRNNLTQIIGVLKLSEQEDNSPLSNNEKSFLEAFSIFSGLGINNCIMYDNILKGQAHQKVALEALSYHTAARQCDVDKLKMSVIPSCHAFNLTSLTFDDFSLLENEMLTASIRMFMEFGFLKKYQIEYEVLCRFLITVKNNYRRVIYHNWRHAFNVTQSMFAVLTAGKVSEQLSSSECLSLLVGCLCHDLDHRGTNNEFQLKTDSPLVKLYGTSTMEHHHFNRAVMILNSEGNNIFSHLQSEEYRKVMKLLKHAILATDLSNYIRQRETFSNAIKTKSFNTNKPENRAMLRSMLMTACDLSGITKPWNIQKRVVHLVTSEFFHQGDIEKHRLNVQPKQMMDRKYILQLPKLQVQFFEMMGIPVYEILAEFNENLSPLSEGAKRNKSKWLEMSAQIEQGHVNPDIESVLHPVKNEDEIFYP